MEVNGTGLPLASNDTVRLDTVDGSIGILNCNCTKGLFETSLALFSGVSKKTLRGKYLLRSSVTGLPLLSQPYRASNSVRLKDPSLLIKEEITA